jgi:hypothetical protein
MLSFYVQPRWWQKSGRRPSHNTRIAVARILGNGKRHRTRVFSELQSHYLFTDRFGRPGKGNDKGKVEGLVGYDLFLEPSFSRGVHFVQYHSLVEVLNGYATQRRPKPYISS